MPVRLLNHDLEGFTLLPQDKHSSAASNKLGASAISSRETFDQRLLHRYCTELWLPPQLKTQKNQAAKNAVPTPEIQLMSRGVRAVNDLAALKSASSPSPSVAPTSAFKKSPQEGRGAAAAAPHDGMLRRGT